jgi:rod shape-determining protein MreD
MIKAGFYIKMCLLVFVVLLLQSQFPSRLMIAGLKPDLILVMLISWAMIHDPKQGMLWGGAFGSLQDVLVGSHDLLYTVNFIIIGGLAGYFQSGIFKTDQPFVALLTFFLSAAAYLLYFLMTFVMNREPFVVPYAAILTIAFYNSLMSFIILPVLDLIKGSERDLQEVRK